MNEPSQAAAQTSPESQPGRVLIVEDDDSVRAALERLLRSAHIPAAGYCGGADYLAHAQPRPGDCVVSDILMPGMSGLELHRRVRRGAAWLPFIFITASENTSLHAEALNGGGIACLRKPFSDEALFAAIKAARESSG